MFFPESDFYEIYRYGVLGFWDGLISAIDATGCESVYLTHGYTATFTRYLNEIGFDAHEVHTLYGDDEDASPQSNAEETGIEENSENKNKVLSPGEDLGEAEAGRIIG